MIGLDRSEFRVRLFPTLFLVFSAITLIPLAIWQFDRYVEQAAIENLRDARINQEPRAVSTGAELKQDDTLFRRHIVRGELLDRVSYVYDPSQGGRCQVVSPLRLDDGAIALVVRGYVPSELRMRCMREDVEIVTGSEWHALAATPEGNIVDLITREAKDDRDWAALDIDGIFASWELESDIPVVLLLDPQHAGDPLPRPSWDRVTNPYLTAVTHLSYSFTWLMVFLVCAGFWVVVCMGTFDPQEDEPPAR